MLRVFGVSDIAGLKRSVQIDCAVIPVAVKPAAAILPWNTAANGSGGKSKTFDGAGRRLRVKFCLRKAQRHTDMRKPDAGAFAALNGGWQ